MSILSKQLKNERIKSIKTKFKLQSSLADLEDKHFSKSIETTAATGKNFKTTVDDQQENSRDSAENLNLPISFKSNSETISDLNSEKAADVLNYFQNLMENKKSRMWPSRRIDELQNLTVKQ